MKSFRVIAFILLAVLLLSACKTSYPDPPPGGNLPAATGEQGEENFDNRFGMGFDKLIETDDAYYLSHVNSVWLYYYDKASGESGVLCGKPDCMHDEGKNNPDCNGLIAQIGACLNLWNGRLHYFSHDHGPYLAMYSMALDGSDRTKDFVINQEADMQNITPQRLDYHRGKLYGEDVRETVRGGEPLEELIVFSMDAGTGEFREIYTAEGAWVTDAYLYYHENYVYISYEEYTLIEYEDRVEFDSFCWHLVRWNIDTEQIEEVVSADADELNDTATGRRIFIGDDDRIWFAPQSNNLTSPLKVYLLEDGQISEAFRFETTGPCFLIENAAVSIFIFEKRWEVRRLDGSLIYMGELDTSWLDGLDEDMSYSLDAISSIMGTADEVFISFYVEADDGSGTERICLVRYDMTGEKPVPTLIANARWD